MPPNSEHTVSNNSPDHTAQTQHTPHSDTSTHPHTNEQNDNVLQEMQQHNETNVILFNLRPRGEFTRPEHNHVQKAHRCPPKSQKRNATSCAQKACKTKRRACATAQGGRPHNWDRQHTRWHEKATKSSSAKKKGVREPWGSHKDWGTHANFRGRSHTHRPI